SVVALRRRDLERFVDRREEPWWLELQLSPRWAGEALVLHYPNLFAAPIERTLVNADWAVPPLDRELADKTSMDDLRDAEQDHLEALLYGLPEPEAVAVYDVGHGNCTATVDRGTPALYFD